MVEVKKGMRGVIWQTYWVLQTTNLISSFIVSFKTHPNDWWKSDQIKFFRRNFDWKMGHTVYTMCMSVSVFMLFYVDVFSFKIAHHMYIDISMYDMRLQCLDFCHSSCLFYTSFNTGVYVRANYSCFANILYDNEYDYFNIVFSFDLNAKLYAGNSKLLFANKCCNKTMMNNNNNNNKREEYKRKYNSKCMQCTHSIYSNGIICFPIFNH